MTLTFLRRRDVDPDDQVWENFIDEGDVLHVCVADHRYSVCICVCEIVGCTAVIPYCLMLLRRCHYCGTGSGLPADDGHFKLPPEKRFKIRVLIPCYKVRL